MITITVEAWANKKESERKVLIYCHYDQNLKRYLKVLNSDHVISWEVDVDHASFITAGRWRIVAEFHNRSLCVAFFDTQENAQYYFDQLLDAIARGDEKHYFPKNSGFLKFLG